MVSTMTTGPLLVWLAEPEKLPFVAVKETDGAGAVESTGVGCVEKAVVEFDAVTGEPGVEEVDELDGAVPICGTLDGL